MIFLLLLIHQLLVILQVLEWPALAVATEVPYATISLVLATAVLVIQRRMKIINIHLFLTMGLIFVILVSAIFAGWLGGGVARAQNLIFMSILPFFVYSNFLVTQKTQERIFFLFLVYSILMLGNGISQLNSEIGRGWFGSFASQGDRITFLGIVNDPNDLAGYFLLCMPFALYFIRYKESIFYKLFGLSCLISLLYAIFLTNSRGGLIAFGAVSFAYLIYRYGYFRSSIVGAIVSPAAIYAAASFRTIEMDSSVQGRVESWYNALQMFESNPLFGIGLGNFVENNALLTAHNSFVLVLAELGIIGYMLWFTIIILPTYMSYHLLILYRNTLIKDGFRIDNSTALNRALGMNSVIFFSLLGYLATTFFLSRSYAFFTFLICAFAVASYNRVISIQPEYSLDIAKVTKRILALSLVTVIIMYIATRFLLGLY